MKHGSIVTMNIKFGDDVTPITGKIGMHSSGARQVTYFNQAGKTLVMPLFENAVVSINMEEDVLAYAKNLLRFSDGECGSDDYSWFKSLKRDDIVRFTRKDSDGAQDIVGRLKSTNGRYANIRGYDRNKGRDWTYCVYPTAIKEINTSKITNYFAMEKLKHG